MLKGEKMTNRICSIMLVLTLVVTAVIIPQATAVVYTGEQPISVTINGERVVFDDQNPVIVGSRTLVPVRGVFEKLGFDVSWAPDTRQAILTSDAHTVVITIGSATFTVNGANRTLDVPAQIIGDRTMLPIRAVVESVGYFVDWDNATRTVLITGDEQYFTIGAINFMEHPALAEALQGFKDGLAANGFIVGENITLIYDNAQGEIAALATIADRFVAQNVDMILSITTPAVQAVAAATETIPVLGTAVTNYVVAGVIDSNERPGGNITGTSDMIPVSEQIDLMVELVPDVETIGLIYNSSDFNARFQIEIAKERILELGLQYHEVTVTRPGEVYQAMQSLVGRVQAVYVPADNTMASAMPTVRVVAMEAGLPTVCGANIMVMNGGLATVVICYHELGFITGLMAIDVLVNGADTATMPIQFAQSNFEIIINGVVAEEIGFTIPERFRAYVIYPE